MTLSHPAASTSHHFRCLDPHPDTNVTALVEGYVTVTPLQFNMTDYGRLQEMTEWDWYL